MVVAGVRWLLVLAAAPGLTAHRRRLSAAASQKQSSGWPLTCGGYRRLSTVAGQRGPAELGLAADVIRGQAAPLFELLTPAQAGLPRRAVVGGIAVVVPGPGASGRMGKRRRRRRASRGRRRQRGGKWRNRRPAPSCKATPHQNKGWNGTKVESETPRGAAWANWPGEVLSQTGFGLMKLRLRPRLRPAELGLLQLRPQLRLRARLLRPPPPRPGELGLLRLPVRLRLWLRRSSPCLWLRPRLLRRRRLRPRSFRSTGLPRGFSSACPLRGFSSAGLRRRGFSTAGLGCAAPAEGAAAAACRARPLSRPLPPSFLWGAGLGRPRRKRPQTS